VTSNETLKKREGKEEESEGGIVLIIRRKGMV